MRCYICDLKRENCICKAVEFQANWIAKFNVNPRLGLKREDVKYPPVFVSRCLACWSFPCKCKSKVWC